MNKQVDIKHVAIYLRKSRDEGEYDDVLSKHRDTLVPYAKVREWTYLKISQYFLVAAIVPATDGTSPRGTLK